MALTQSQIQLHALGKKDSYDVGLLDVAQDHALYLLELGGFFESGDVVFKGGTSLRKCRLGAKGRFSTDIDLAVPNDDTVLAICAALDGQSISGFRFAVRDAGKKDGRIWHLDVEHPQLGKVMTASSLEFARRRPALAPERLAPLPMNIHDQYDFKLGPLPVMRAVEMCAEKLARYRHRPFARDLYDLNYFATLPLEEPPLRRLWVLKVYCDVIEDKRGDKPLEADEITRERDIKLFDAGDIGALTQPIDIAAWERKVRARFSFLANLDADEKRFALMNAREHDEVLGLLAAGGFAPEPS